MRIMTTTAAHIRRWLPRRERTAHKGNFGKVLLLCGAVGYTGAPVLAARAAVRSGAGLVFVGVPEAVYPIVAGNLVEPMVFPLPSAEGMLSEAAIPEILRRLAGCDACLIGCGLGRSPGTFAVVKAVLEQARCPVVVDADGINVLEGHIDIVRGAACPVILTPHEGEFRRLGGDSSLGRLHGTCKLQGETGAVLLRKGHRTLICDGTECYVNRTGNPGMATGGSGDALAGILVSLLGQGLPPVRAAAAAAWLHGAAGDLCARTLGEYGMLPTDLIEALPRLLK
ncbi:MAG: NAD(P)H-hydrate dehydratase [Oscillospiraceae bacterium]|nr:NAD(P)H-hydrate dehydratase [Oscillospiraceae bacterium]